ncbi:hypothetical protein [Methylobacterium sp. 77]|uniref:hypothetical protein n=1 Tax=Methylobacterium sp. 77 TaxID=1101192 RepID=UPI00036F998C|nr:hypothetical protein [Methylobacterium sp. 77]
MTKKLLTTLALVFGMASPAFADGARTIHVWGANVESPDQSSRQDMAPADGAHQNGPSLRWANMRAAARIPATTSDLPLYAGDEDGGNARDPALPSDERGRGQETGGPARELIPN